MNLANHTPGFLIGNHGFAFSYFATVKRIRHPFHGIHHRGDVNGMAEVLGQRNC